MNIPEYTIPIMHFNEETGWEDTTVWANFNKKRWADFGHQIGTAAAVERYGGRTKRDISGDFILVFAKESDMAWFLLEFG